jgi:hypothetical protein
MECESALEGWKIRKRIESGAYLGRKVSVAESLTGRALLKGPKVIEKEKLSGQSGMLAEWIGW